MKALTVSQPFASLIADGVKWVENRNRLTTNYRGLLAIHAGKGTQYLDRDELKAYPYGIVAVAMLKACLSLEAMQEAFAAGNGLGELSYVEVGLTLEHEHTEGAFCWILEDIVKLPEPIVVSGAQGLWQVPTGIRLTVEARLAALT